MTKNRKKESKKDNINNKTIWDSCIFIKHFNPQLLLWYNNLMKYIGQALEISISSEDTEAQKAYHTVKWQS
jgi:hypothetical protein